MDIKTLIDIPPWEWPQETDETLLRILRNNSADESERLLAAELAGDYTVINDDLAEILLSITCRGDQPENIRAKAAISFGPALEQGFLDAFEDPDSVPISEGMFNKIRESLYHLYMDASTPKEVRRRILEASVRAPQDWHKQEIQTAYSSDDEEWNLTAVFCMRFVRGFDDEILEALNSKNPEIHHEAVCAAGNWSVDAAWPHIAALLASKGIEKSLLLAAIEAVGGIRPKQAKEILCDLLESDDEDIVDAVYESLAIAEGLAAEDDYQDALLN